MEDGDSDAEIACLRNSRNAITVPKGIYVDEAKHVAHDTSLSVRLSQLPLAPAVSASATGSNLAQSREADDSTGSMFPLSDPDY